MENKVLKDLFSGLNLKNKNDIIKVKNLLQRKVNKHKQSNKGMLKLLNDIKEKHSENMTTLKVEMKCKVD